jgi:polar amino acid transport system permease protein
MKMSMKARDSTSSPSGLAGAAGGKPIDAAPVRHYGQWVVAAVLVVIIAALAKSIWTNPNIDHPTVSHFLTFGAIMDGLVTTIELTAVSAIIGWLIGVLVAVCRLSSNPILRALSWLFIWIFRTTPLLVQILVWGNLALLFRTLEIGIPFTDITFVSLDTNKVITSFVASIIALALNEGAYMAEVVRGGILAVDRGQSEAAHALGMRPGQVMRRIVLPQALPVIIPPTGNQFINLLKATSLVSVIAGGDLLTKAQNIAAVNIRTLELLIVATFWYFVIVSVVSVGQWMLERKLAQRHR